MADTRQENYNKFLALPIVPYKIISHLLTNDDYIWKLIFYNSADAWMDSKQNLTSDQKAALIYDGVKPINDCRIFMDTGADDAWHVESTQLRISVTEAVPTNYVYGSLYIAFEIYTHYSINTLSCYQPRNLTIAQRLMEVFNGCDVEGIGRVFFDARATNKARLTLAYGAIPYKGLSIIMGVKSLG